MEFLDLGAGVFIATDDGSLGERGLVTQIVESRIQNRPPDGIYACGPVKMLEAVESLAAGYHLACQLSWEAHMRCGIGLCGSCELILSGGAPRQFQSAPHHRPGWLVCLDGPVAQMR
jgi:dihydroorotate dehydrogenase electron transfer subunit